MTGPALTGTENYQRASDTPSQRVLGGGAPPNLLRAGMALGLRQALGVPMNALGAILAARLLGPPDFGLFAVFSVLVTLALFVVDAGTSNAIVRDREEASIELAIRLQWYKGVALAGCLLAYLLFSPFLLRYFHLPKWVAYLLVSAAAVGWLQSQRNYLASRLQRRLFWDKLVGIELVEILAYNVVLLTSAYFLHNALSFVIALAGRCSIGSLLLRRHVPPLAAARSSQSTKGLIRFGLPMQGTAILSLIQDSLNPIAVGSLAGLNAVGLINWAGYVTSVPRLPLHPLPAFLFSVVAHRDREGHTDQGYLRIFARLGTIFVTAASLMILLSLGAVVPRLFGKAWMPAIPIASILIFTNSTFFPSLVMTSFLNGKGFSAANLSLSGLWVIMTWVCGLGGLLAFGPVGYAAGILLASIIGLVVQCWITDKLTGLRLSAVNTVAIIGSAIVSLFAVWVVNRPTIFVSDAPAVLRNCALGLVAMSIALVVVQRTQLRTDMRALLWLGKRFASSSR